MDLLYIYIYIYILLVYSEGSNQESYTRRKEGRKEGKNRMSEQASNKDHGSID